MHFSPVRNDGGMMASWWPPHQKTTRESAAAAAAAAGPAAPVCIISDHRIETYCTVQCTVNGRASKLSQMHSLVALNGTLLGSELSRPTFFDRGARHYRLVATVQNLIAKLKISS